MNLGNLGICLDDIGWFDISAKFAALDFSGFRILMRQEGYCATLLGMLGALPYRFCSPSMWAVKCTGIWLGQLALILFFCTTKQLYGKYIAAVCVALLGTHLSFIICAQTVLRGEVVLQVMLTCLWLFFFTKAVKTSKKHFLFAGALCAGIALWAKATTVGALGGTIAGLAAATVMYPQQTYPVKRLLFRNIALLATGFIIGISPLLIDTLLNHGHTFRNLFVQVTSNTPSGWDNRNILSNLHIRLGHLVDFFTLRNSLHYAHKLKYTAYGMFTLLCWCKLLIDALRGKNKNAALSLGLVCFFAVFFLLTVFVPKYANSQQLNILFPFPELLIGAFIYSCLIDFKQSRIFITATAAYIGTTLLLNLVFAANYHKLTSKGIACSDLTDPTISHQISSYLNKTGQKFPLVHTRNIQPFAIFHDQLNRYVLSTQTPLVINASDTWQHKPLDSFTLLSGSHNITPLEIKKTVFNRTYKCRRIKIFASQNQFYCVYYCTLADKATN